MKRLKSSLMPPGSAVLLLALLATTGSVLADSDIMQVGQLIRDFSWPQDSNGVRQAVLHGREAKVVTSLRTEILDMKIELYENGQPTTIITSPFCNFWRAENKLSTDKTVLIQKPNMEITAQTMQWDYVNNRGILRDNVKVVLKNFSLADPLQQKAQTATNQPAAPTPTPPPTP